LSLTFNKKVKDNAMAFSDPQSIDPGTGAVSLPRTSSGANTGTFTSADGSLVLTVASILGKRTRRTARITLNKIVTDPYVTDRNVPVSASFYVVLDTPSVGFTAAEMKSAVIGLATWLTASSGAKTAQLVGGEN